MLPEAKLLCSRAPRRVEFHSVRWMAAVDRFTPLKLAPLRDQSTDPGGTWTCLNPTWCNWYDLTLVNRVAVSNILGAEFLFQNSNSSFINIWSNEWLYIFSIFINLLMKETNLDTQTLFYLIPFFNLNFLI